MKTWLRVWWRHFGGGQRFVCLAVRDGAGLRVRPLSMTAIATIAGLLPIMLGSGTGSEVMRRIAAPMVGGMASALVLTLVVLPAIYLLWRRFELSRAGKG